MDIQTYTGGYAQTNGYLIQTDQATLLFDAPAGIADWVKAQNITVTHLLLTHQHWDHSHDVAYFENAEVIAFDDPSEDLILQQRFRDNYGIPLEVKPYQITKKLKHQEQYTIGSIQLTALHVPGHSPDSLAFHIPDQQICISGDVILYTSTGRTDLPGGDGQQLFHSIDKILFSLPESTRLYTGHGPTSLISEQKKNNEYKLML